MTLLQKIESLANGDLAAGKQLLRDRIASGDFISTLARELGVSRPALSNALNATDEEKQLVIEARQEGAHALVEKALAVVESVGNDRDEVAAARLKYDALTWAARKMNRDAYDDKPANVQVSVAGELFLRAVSSPAALRTPRSAPTEVVADAEPALLPAPSRERKRASRE